MSRHNTTTVDDAYEIGALEAMWRRAQGELLAQQLALDRARRAPMRRRVILSVCVQGESITEDAEDLGL